MLCCTMVFMPVLQVFGHPEWAAHRSTNRYFRHTKGLLTSRIVRGLVGPLLYVGLISLAVSTYELMLNNGTLAEWGYNGLPKIALEITGPFSLSTFGRLELLCSKLCFLLFTAAQPAWS